MADTKRGGIFFTIFQIVFTLPFVLAGLFAFYQGVTHGPASLLVFGVLFAGVPGFMLLRTFRGMRSNEAQALVQKPGPALAIPTTFTADYRSPGRVRVPAGALYANLLLTGPLPKITTERGLTLPVALRLAKSADSPILLLIFSIIWLFLSAPVFVGGLLTKTWGLAAFLAIFVAVGAFLLSLSLKRLLSRTKLPRVEVAEEPLYLGDTLRVHLAQPGPANIRRLQVDLLCRERVQYTVGTTVRTEERDVLTFSMLDDEGGVIARGGSKTHDLEVQIPKASPSTFFSKNNNVAWLVRIRADILNFPDYDEIYEVRVLPEPPIA